MCRERTRNTGIISCTVCLEEFQTPITCILSISFNGSNCYESKITITCHRGMDPLNNYTSNTYLKENVKTNVNIHVKVMDSVVWSVCLTDPWPYWFRPFGSSGRVQWLDRCLWSSQSVAVVSSDTLNLANIPLDSLVDPASMVPFYITCLVVSFLALRSTKHLSGRVSGQANCVVIRVILCLYHKMWTL